MKKVFLRLAVLSLSALAVLFVVDMLYRKTHSLEYKLPHNLLPNPPIAEKYKVVKLGNSHSQEGITFERYNVKGLDLSGVAQRFEFDLALLKQYRNEIDEGAVILINASPISFAHTAANSKKGFQQGYYRRVSPFFIPYLNWGDYIESEFLPFVRSGYLWRKKNTETIRERIAQEEKWVEPSPTPSPAVESPKVEEKTKVKGITQDAGKASPSAEVSKENYFFTVQFIEAELQHPSGVKDGPYMDNIDFTFNKWYHTDEFNPDYFAANRKDLENLIAYCKKNNWRPVLITVPITANLEDALLDDYKQVYLYDNIKKTDLQGVEYIDFSDDPRIKTNTALFSNSDHLNKNGAAIFSYVLLRKLIEKEYLPQEADGYNNPPLRINKK